MRAERRDRRREGEVCWPPVAQYWTRPKNKNRRNGRHCHPPDVMRTPIDGWRVCTAIYTTRVHTCVFLCTQNDRTFVHIRPEIDRVRVQRPLDNNNTSYTTTPWRSARVVLQKSQGGRGVDIKTQTDDWPWPAKRFRKMEILKLNKQFLTVSEENFFMLNKCS